MPTQVDSSKKVGGVLGVRAGCRLLALVAATVPVAFGHLGSASAVATHEYLCQITGGGSSSPSATECDKTGSANPGGLLSAVNAMTTDNGRLLIAGHIEGGLEYRVDSFDASTGAFEAAFVDSPALTVVDQGIAVGHAAGEEQIYVGYTSGEKYAGDLAIFDAAGELIGSWTGADTPGGAFAPGIGVAVDDSMSPTDWAAGDVYVVRPEPNGHSAVDVFKPKPHGGEEYVAQITGPPGEPLVDFGTIAVDQTNGDVLLVNNQNAIDVFEPTIPGEYAFVREIQATPKGQHNNASLMALAVDPETGDVYAGYDESAQGGTVGFIEEFGPAGEYLGGITGAAAPTGLSKLESLAFDPVTHHLYVGGDMNDPLASEELRRGAVDVFGPNIVIPDVATAAPSEVGSHGAVLNGTVNPDGEGIATCGFDWGTTQQLSEFAACEATVPNGGAPAHVQAKLADLQPDTTYFYRLQATNHNGTNPGEESQDREFTTQGPGIHAASASAVTSASAELEAAIDPHGAPTTYFFEYGTGPSYGTQLPASPGTSIGAGESDVEVSRHLAGLEPDTLYHYRVVARSEAAPGEVEEFAGPDHTFTTQRAGGVLSLPDGRAWELVSPPDKHGAAIFPISYQGVVQAAAGGDAVTYLASADTETEAEGSANLVQVLSARGTGGWHSRDIAPPHSAPTSFSLQGEEYRFFSEDLSLGVVQPQGPFEQSLSPQATEPTAYLHTDFAPGDPSDLCASSCYRPLVTGASGVADVAEGVQFGGEYCTEGLFCGPWFEGATPDASHIVLSSEVGLTDEIPGEKGGLYEYSASAAPAEQLRPVSVLPNGQAAALSTNPHLGLPASRTYSADPRNAISLDGSRVVWSESVGSGEPWHLYLRYNATAEQSKVENGRCTEPRKACTIQLDAVQGGNGSGVAGAAFQDASTGDARIFFTDEQLLTANAGGKLGEPDLYECQIVENGEGGLSCSLTDLTPRQHGEGADVGEKFIPGVSANGSYVYFVAAAALAGAESNPRGEAAQQGQRNLYLAHDGVTSLVAVLSSADEEPLHVQDISQTTRRVSPDGRWLAFMSDRPLTGYDNRDAVSGQPDEEVFLYHASAEPGGAATLVCASCNPTGARPQGREYASLKFGNGGLVGGEGVWPLTQWIAANIPGWTPYSQEDGAAYQSRYLSGSGRLFFNSSDALVPQDTNGNEDVYEYEPVGEGGCSQAGATYSEASGGCVDLISSGTSPQESAFMDASENGDDVFFLTKAQLVATDVDTSNDVYDAHVCSAEAPCPAQPLPQPPPCAGDACQAPVEAPNDPTPDSLTFNGPGNVASSLSAPTATTSPVVQPKRTGAGAPSLARAVAKCRRRYRGSKQRRTRCEHAARAKHAAARKGR